MKRIFHSLRLVFFLFVFVSAGSLSAEPQDTQEDIPVTPLVDVSPVWAEVYPEKSELRPGETVKLTLTNFRYKENRPESAKNIDSTIIIKSSAGLVLDGTSVVLNEDFYSDEGAGLGNVKAFLLPGGENQIDVYYRAPLRGENNEVKIEVFVPSLFHLNAEERSSEETTVTWETDLEGRPMVDRGRIIAEEILRIKWGTYLLLNYKETKKVKRGSKERYTHEINAVIRIDCKPGFAGNMMMVSNLEVLEFKGRAELTGSDFQRVQEAASAESSLYNPLVMLYMDPDSQQIKGFIYEAVPLNVDWQGDEIPEGPPDVVNMGPVSEHKKNPLDARWHGELVKEEFPGKGKDAEKNRRRQQFALQNFAATQVHPDNMVTEGDGKTFFKGQGEWTESSSSRSHKKSYTWELYITDK